MSQESNGADLQEAVGRYLHGLAAWRWWMTLTFRRYLPFEEAQSVFKQWLRSVARHLVKEHFVVAWALEVQARGVPHYHVLLATPPMVVVTSTAIQAFWRSADERAGFSRVNRFDLSKRAAWYMAIGPHWDMNVVCPRIDRRCKRRACVEAPGPW